MHAITLKQPWAYAVCHLGKRIENRGWKPSPKLIGQRVAIHAGVAIDDDGWDHVDAHHGLPEDRDELPRGAVVDTVWGKANGEPVCESSLRDDGNLYWVWEAENCERPPAEAGGGRVRGWMSQSTCGAVTERALSASASAAFRSR